MSDITPSMVPAHAGMPSGPAIQQAAASEPRPLPLGSPVSMALAETQLARPYVDWAAIVAGAVVAAAIFVLFTAFGSGIGLSMVSVIGGNALPPMGLLVAAALWGLWMQVSSYMAGGYVAGRMRQRIGDAKQGEVEVRDGTHGLVTWALGMLVGAVIVGMAGSFAAGAVSNAVSGTATAALSVAGDDLQYHAERLLRPATMPPTAAEITPPAIAATTTQTDSASGNAAIAALLARVQANPAPDDRDYLAAQIARRAGITTAQAEQRLEAATQEIAAAADRARRAAVLMAFFTAASLVLSAVAAWWAAVKGGEHRDQGIDHSKLARWR